jgi:hypothetical protein
MCGKSGPVLSQHGSPGRKAFVALDQELLDQGVERVRPGGVGSLAQGIEFTDREVASTLRDVCSELGDERRLSRSRTSGNHHDL